MPRRTIVIDYRVCDPTQCEEGVCKAALVCERKILTQKTPYDMPDTKASMCMGCAICLQACPKKALRLM